MQRCPFCGYPLAVSHAIVTNHTTLVCRDHCRIAKLEFVGDWQPLGWAGLAELRRLAAEIDRQQEKARSDQALQDVQEALHQTEWMEQK
jgi:hypothetical protein